VISGQVSSRRRQECEKILTGPAAAAAEFLGVGELEQLPELYRKAAVMAVPALHESFGLAVLESLACGTPVAAARHAALPELVEEGETGVLFDPGPLGGEEVQDVGALAEALLRGLELAALPGTAERCVRSAQAYSWNRMAPLYAEYLARSVRAGRGSRWT